MSIKLLKEYVTEVLSEAPVPLRKPQTQDQKIAFVRLLQWAGPKMGAPEEMIEDAVSKATNEDNWDDAIDLMKDYYVMKGIKFQRAS